MIRTVISDLGKVIVHFDNRIFFERLSSVCGLPVDEVIRLAFEGKHLFNAFDAGTLNPDEFRRAVCGPLGVDLGLDEFFALYTDIFRLIPGTLEVLSKARKSCRLVLLSNTDPVRYAFLRRTYPQILIFDAYVISFIEKLMKPDPRIFELALARAEARPAECVFIDDRPENVQAAEAMGMQGVVFKENETDLAAALLRAGVDL